MMRTRITIEEDRLVCAEKRFSRRCRTMKDITELRIDKCPTPPGTQGIGVQLFVMGLLGLLLVSVLIRYGVSTGAIVLAALLFLLAAMWAVLLHHQRLRKGPPPDAVACVTILFKDKTVYEGYITDMDTITELEKKMT